jgi:hypothetical protein
VSSACNMVASAARSSVWPAMARSSMRSRTACGGAIREWGARQRPRHDRRWLGGIRRAREPARGRLRGRSAGGDGFGGGAGGAGGGDEAAVLFFFQGMRVVKPPDPPAPRAGDGRAHRSATAIRRGRAA